MNHRMTLLIALLAAFSFATIACESKSEDKKEEGEEGGGEEGGGDEWAELAVPDLGIKIDAPAGAEVKPGIGGLGFDVSVDGIPKASLSEASEFKPKTLEAAKTEVTGGMYIEAAVGAEATTDNGWTLTWTNKGGMGTNYWVWSAQTVGGKSIFCEMTANDEDQQAAALKICSSIRQ